MELIENKLNVSMYRPSNAKAFTYLILPTFILVLGVAFVFSKDAYLYWLGELVLSIFFLQSFILLHECGHVLQPVTNTGVNCYKNIDEDLKPKEFSMKRFINEVDAWDKGLKLADELGIHIDIKKYDKEKDIALLTYFV